MRERRVEVEVERVNYLPKKLCSKFGDFLPNNNLND